MLRSVRKRSQVAKCLEFRYERNNSYEGISIVVRRAYLCAVPRRARPEWY